MGERRASALFLDRDGVINLDYGYVHRVRDFEFVPGIFELVKMTSKKVVVITNQSGIGRGYYTKKDFDEVTKFMEQEFSSKAKPIEKVYHCPFHPEAALPAYRSDHFDRKPNPGMFLKAEKELNLDMRRSIMIGDKVSDIVAAHRAGVKNLILISQQQAEAPGDISFFEVKTLNEALELFSTRLDWVRI